MSDEQRDERVDAVVGLGIAGLLADIPDDEWARIVAAAAAQGVVVFRGRTTRGQTVSISRPMDPERWGDAG